MLNVAVFSKKTKNHKTEMLTVSRNCFPHHFIQSRSRPMFLFRRPLTNVMNQTHWPMKERESTTVTDIVVRQHLSKKLHHRPQLYYVVEITFTSLCLRRSSVLEHMSIAEFQLLCWLKSSGSHTSSSHQRCWVCSAGWTNHTLTLGGADHEEEVRFYLFILLMKLCLFSVIRKVEDNY